MIAINTHAAVGAGKYRRPWAIREYLSSQGLSMADVARRLDITPSVAARTVRGVANNRRVLRELLRLGCPAGVLGLPEDMRGE
jgi:transcriptional regulator with XRE-family HTH domain